MLMLQRYSFFSVYFQDDMSRALHLSRCGRIDEIDHCVRILRPSMPTMAPVGSGSVVVRLKFTSFAKRVIGARGEGKGEKLRQVALLRPRFAIFVLFLFFMTVVN